MENEKPVEVTQAELEERQRRRDVRRAVVFGILMATVQMGILLYFVYC
jgi:hypothetical protein